MTEIVQKTFYHVQYLMFYHHNQTTFSSDHEKCETKGVKLFLAFSIVTKGVTDEGGGGGGGAGKRRRGSI